LSTEALTVVNASHFSAAAWTFSSWETTDTIEIDGTSGGDSLTGSSRADTINGGIGNEMLQGGPGNGGLDGGADSHTARSQSRTGVTVALAVSGPQDPVGAGLDTLANIENLTGSLTGADQLTGDGGANVLSGLGGDDRLDGGAGNDALSGAAGKDVLLGGDGKDTLIGGYGRGVKTGGPDPQGFVFKPRGET